MRLEPRIIFKLLLNVSDFESQYSYKHYSYEKGSILKSDASSVSTYNKLLVASTNVPQCDCNLTNGVASQIRHVHFDMI